MNHAVKVITSLGFATLLLSNASQALDQGTIIPSKFKTKFENTSSSKLKVEVFHSSGELLKTKFIDPGKSYKFLMSFGCKKTKERSSKVWETPTGSLIGDGDFTMITGRKSSSQSECLHEEYKFDACNDKDGSDGYGVSCTYTRSHDGKYNRSGIISIKAAN